MGSYRGAGAVKAVDADGRNETVLAHGEEVVEPHAIDRSGDG
jgi:hypothetical protein